MEGGEALHTVTISPADQCCVVVKPTDNIARGPAAEIVERLRQIPMIETDPGLDAGQKQFVDEPVIECETQFIRRAASLRQRARPGDRKAISVHAELLHQRDIFAIAVIVVAGDVSGVVVLDLASVAVRVPHAQAAAILVRRALDLIARSGYAPDEVAG